ncbi:MAG: hypothetical protein L0Z50_23745 [Verrucomicrobiales bacterium]|nr:hypothetical protein [Verrucomicrobiales bacterium]
MQKLEYKLNNLNDAGTLEAFKDKQGPCFERNQAVIYLGPFQEVLDDD